jgi:hypothetical protein
LKEKGDPRLGKLEFSKAVLDAGPEPVAFFSLGEIKLGGQLGQALKLDGVEVLVVTVDDLSLIGRIVGHSTVLLARPRAAEIEPRRSGFRACRVLRDAT